MTTTSTPPKGKGKPPAGKGGKYGFLKDKRVLAAMAAAGALGLVVLLKKGGGSTAADANQASSSGPGTYDSSSMDSYDAISQLGQGLSDQLGGYTTQLQDILTQLGKVNGPTSGSVTPPLTKGPPPKKKPPRTPNTSTGQSAQYTYTTAFTTASAARGSNWGSTLSTIAGHYHESLSSLLKLNPGIKNPNQIGVHQKIRVK